MSQEELDSKCLEDLGFGPSVCLDLRSTRYPERVEKLRKLKEEARKLYRAKVLEIHPDKHNGSPEKSAELARLNFAYSRIQEVRADEFHPIRRVTHRRSTFFDQSSNTTTSTVNQYGWNQVRIVINWG